MKNAYSIPKLTVYGDVAEITQILGSSSRTDFLFFNGNSISGGDDQGSRDLNCTRKGKNLNCEIK
ncbi:lasso peptide [Fischerella sp. JS2]|uniref:lasso peptide n=1 Tax=Fischerella sp. JS2 TaxID=2597771 RepID=UPI0028E64847|nr:lasso peptide [Fischerella sp. JS2]